MPADFTRDHVNCTVLDNYAWSVVYANNFFTPC